MKVRKMTSAWISIQVIFVLNIFPICSVQTATIKDVKLLKEKLMDKYDKTILPIKNQSAEFVVDAAIELRSISDLDEIRGRMTTVMVVQLFWVDESFVWKKGVHSDLDHITMEAEKVWKPSLAVPNSHARTHHIHDWDLIDYLPSGNCRWITMKTFETSCDLDTTFYPFDAQRCSVELFIYGYYGRIVFNPIYFDELHMAEYDPQGTWSVTDYYVSHKNGSNVTLTYHLQRNPRYMILNFLIPIIILSLLNPLVFLLPPDSGERIGYSVTIMLALSVYMTLLGDYLPQDSDPIPLITYKIMFWYILSAMTLIFLFLSTRIHFKRDSHPMPRFVRTFVVVLKAIFCLKLCREDHADECDRTTNQDNVEETATPANEKNIKLETVKRKQISRRPINNGCTCVGHERVTWQNASKALDIFFMVMIYVVKILFMVIFMSLLSQRPDLERQYIT